MDYKHWILYVGISCVAIIPEFSRAGTFNSRPPHISTGTGVDVTLNCDVTLETNEHFEWSEQITSHTGQKIYDSRNPSNILHRPEKFSVTGSKEQTGRGTHNLVIKNVEVLDGGTYVARISSPSGDSTSNSEVLIFAVPSVITNPQQLRDNRTVMVKCDAQFGSAAKQNVQQNHWPRLEVLIANEQPEGGQEPTHRAGTPGKSAHVLEQIYNLPVQWHHDGKLLECSVITDEPSFKLTLNHTMDVEYEVRNIAISPRPPGTQQLTISVGDHINCSASGNPEPYFRWEPTALPTPDGPQAGPQAGFQLQIIEPMIGENEWECQARNTVPPAASPSVITSRIAFTVVAATGSPIGSDASISSPWLPSMLFILLSWVLL